jgi:hypothetical protein
LKSGVKVLLTLPVVGALRRLLQTTARSPATGPLGVDAWGVRRRSPGSAEVANAEVEFTGMGRSGNNRERSQDEAG